MQGFLTILTVVACILGTTTTAYIYAVVLLRSSAHSVVATLGTTCQTWLLEERVCLNSMAKWGEGDPRWLVQNRDDGKNVNGALLP